MNFGSGRHKRVAALVAIAAAAGCGWTCAAPGASKLAPTGGERSAFAVSLAAPSAGDVSYGIARVRIVTSGRRLGPAAASSTQVVFAGYVGGLAISATSSAWRALRSSTRVYAAVSKVGGAGGSVRDVALFIVRRRTGSRRLDAPTGDVAFSISNATPAVGSFFVRGVDRHGQADIFHVRDLLATAVRNWSRYVRVLRLAGALSAALHSADRNPSAPGAGASGSGGRGAVPWTGGQRPSPRERILFRVLAGALANPLEYASLKRSPLVIDFIARDLNNPRLAKRWRDVTAGLPLRVPDSYAAAAQEEARFTRVLAPRFSRAGVTTAAATNSSSQAGHDIPPFPSYQVEVSRNDSPVGGSATVTGTLFLEISPGRIVPDGENLACRVALQLRCSLGIPKGGFLTERLVATPDAGSFVDGWTGCDSVTDTVTGDKACTVQLTGRHDPLTLQVEFGVSGNPLNVESDGLGHGRVTSSPPGIDCPPTCAAGFDPGAHVSLTATPDAGSTFRRWDDGEDPVCQGQVANPCQFTMPRSFLIARPLFTTTEHLTVHETGAGHVTSSPPGIDCPPTCQADYATDMGTLPNSTATVVTLTATPSPGSVFAQWDDLPGLGNPPGPCVVQVGSPNTCQLYLDIPAPRIDVVALFTGDPPPTASFSATPIPGTAEPAFAFDGSGSSDPDGQLTNYHWDFGDRDTADTTTPTSQHFYSCSGPITVTLTVTDETGQVGSGTQQLTLPGGLPPCIR